METDLCLSAVDLRQFVLFTQLADAELQSLLKVVHPRRLEAGARVFTQDDEAHGFFLVLEGAVKVFKLNPAGQEQVLHVTGKGQSFAEAAVFQGERYPANADCLEDSVLLFVERAGLVELIRSKPDLALCMLAGVSISTIISCDWWKTSPCATPAGASVVICSDCSPHRARWSTRLWCASP